MSQACVLLLGHRGSAAAGGKQQAGRGGSWPLTLSQTPARPLGPILVGGGLSDTHAHAHAQVFVGGMPYSYSREQVEEYWGWCGEVQELDVMTFPDTGRFRWGGSVGGEGEGEGGRVTK